MHLSCPTLLPHVNVGSFPASQSRAQNLQTNQVWEYRFHQSALFFVLQNRVLCGFGIHGHGDGWCAFSRLVRVKNRTQRWERDMGTHVKLKDVREAEPWQEEEVGRSVLLPHAESPPPLSCYSTPSSFYLPGSHLNVTVSVWGPTNAMVCLRLQISSLLWLLSTKGTLTPASFPHTNIQFTQNLIFWSIFDSEGRYSSDSRSHSSDLKSDIFRSFPDRKYDPCNFFAVFGEIRHSRYSSWHPTLTWSPISKSVSYLSKSSLFLNFKLRVRRARG